MDRVRACIGYDAYREGLHSKPCCICILDSGIIRHEDFGNRILSFYDFVDKKVGLYDAYGHGTHIAGICAGSGYRSKGKYQGIAPKSHLVIGKVLGSGGDGKIESLIQGIQWCIKNQKTYNIRLLNISVGLLQQVGGDRQKSLLDAVEHAWDMGIVTVCAAGNNGPKEGSVTIPGSSAKVITVGSAEYGKKINVPSNFSGRGPTAECIAKPEIYAPGKDIVSCSNKGGYVKKTGTSMAVPVVAGGIALLLQEKPWLAPVDIKLRLFEKSKKLEEKEEHSWGTFFLPYFLSDKESFSNKEFI